MTFNRSEPSAKHFVFSCLIEPTQKFYIHFTILPRTKSSLRETNSAASEGAGKKSVYVCPHQLSPCYILILETMITNIFIQSWHNFFCFSYLNFLCPPTT